MTSHPETWWQLHPLASKPEWEILPQEARREAGEVILSKRNELGLLSNFSHTPFEFRGVRYNSIEGFWQMMFYPEGPNDERARFPGLKWNHTRQEVSQMESHEAFAAGMQGFENMRAMGVNYVTFEGKKYEYWVDHRNEHFDLIVEAMRAKLEQNPQVKEVLLATGNLKLRADHYEPADAPPSWQYYQIWMELRSELASQRNLS